MTPGLGLHQPLLGHGPQSQQGTPESPTPHLKVALSKEPKSPCSQHGGAVARARATEGTG